MILYVLRYWPTITETFVRGEIEGLRTRALDVHLAAFDPREGDPADRPCPVHSQPHRWGWLQALPTLVVEWLRRPAIVSVRVLWLTTLVRRATLVHVHFAGEAAEWTRLACRRADRPYVVTVHAADLFRPHPALRAILTNSAAVLTVSVHNQALLRRTYSVVAGLVRMGVPAMPSAARPAAPTVLSVGRNVPKKGLDLVIASARRLPDIQFVLVSDVPDPNLPNVVVTGLLPHAAALERLASASLLALPCRVAPDGDQDGVPVVLMEALAFGIPVVTTPVSGIPELVDERVGWVVPADDVDALVEAITAAVADPEEAGRRGMRGPARLADRGFTRDAQVEAVMEVIGAVTLSPEAG